MPSFRLLEGSTDVRLLEGSTDRRLLESGPATGLEMERVLQDAASFPLAATDCYFHDTYVCCLESNRYRWLNWEGRKAVASDPDTLLVDSQVRLWGSTNEGATWTLVIEFDLPLRMQWNTIFSPSGDILLGAGLDNADYVYDATYSVIARSTDAGLTWTSAVSQALFDALGVIGALTVGFIKLPGTETILSFGRYDLGGDSQVNFLRSTDNGVSFSSFSSTGDFNVTSAYAVSATLVVCTTTANAFYSTDSGSTWTQSSKPSGTVLANGIAARPDGALIIIGRTAASVSAAFISTNDGVSYTQLGLLPSGSGSTAETLTVFNDDVLVAGTNTTPSLLQMWWISEDGGTTWAQASILSDRVASSDVTSITITTDGFVLAGLDRPTRGSIASDNFGEIWRGRLDPVLASYSATCGGGAARAWAYCDETMLMGAA